MYGTIKIPTEFEEYVSLNQLDEIEDKPINSCHSYKFVFVVIFFVILYVGFNVFFIKK
jgi:hypothetical protein